MTAELHGLFATAGDLADYSTILAACILAI